MRIVIAATAALLTTTFISSAPMAEEAGASTPAANVMFIFDSSGSMKKKLQDGSSRSDTAKRALVTALAGMPQTTRLGLLMYGHRRAKDCRDIETISQIGTADSISIASQIMASVPKGETPIAEALQRAAENFAPLAGQSNSIVLVTDGIEECGGDPCSAARAIRDQGLGLKAHVVGFTLNVQQRQTVQCIADETGGKYFDAQGATGLADALAEVKKVVAEAPPEPAKPAYASVFLDEFDGSALQGHWQVEGVSADSGDEYHVVENGAALISIARGKTDEAYRPPVYSLTGIEPPTGDWLATANLELGIQTAFETFAIRQIKDQTVVSAELAVSGDQYYGWTLSARIEKKSGEDITSFDVPIKKLGCNVCGPEQMLDALMAKVQQPLELQLVKEGRSYFARAREAGTEDWVVTDKVTLLGGGGQLGFTGMQRPPGSDAYYAGGESYAFVNRFEILVPSN
jgi:von Willebrand factor type A domain